MTRCVLITGCSSGIGRETALAFLDEEWDVVATARDASDIADLAELGCDTASLDVTDPDDVTRVVESTIAGFGRIDCLVNNAGYPQIGALEDIPTEEVHKQFEANVYGPHRLIRAVLPHMRERENGTIVNVSSISGRISVPGSGPYSASKFALEAMSDALRMEIAPAGIDVVLIEPGPVATNFKERADRKMTSIDRSPAYHELYQLIEDWQALGDAGSIPPSTVAAAIVNAASATQPEPRYVVGGVGKLGTMGRFLPDRIRDTLYRLVYTVSTKRPRE